VSIDPAYVKAWVDRGERDLHTARVMRGEELYDACAVYCQQAVEKLLKAYYLAKLQKEPRKTHKIVELGNELDLPYDLVENLHDLENDYIQARYPELFFDGVGTVYDDAVASERLETAVQAMSWIKEKLAEVVPDVSGNST